MEFIENVRSRTTAEGADINVVYKSDSLGFSSDAGKQWGLSVGSPEVKDKTGKVITKAVLPSKILVARASKGDTATNQAGETVDIGGRLVIFVTNDKMEYVTASGTRRALQTFQLSALLKGNPKSIIEEFVNEFKIGSGSYKSITKDANGLAVLRTGSKKTLEEAGMDDVLHEVKEDVNDFTLTITDKLVEFQLADGGTMEGCFGLLVELNEQSAPKDDRIVKVIHAKKRAKTEAPSNEAVAESLDMIEDEAEIEDEDLEEDEDEDGE